MKTIAEEIYGTSNGLATLTVYGDDLSGFGLELSIPADTESLSREFLEDCAAAIRSHLRGPS